MTGLGTNVLVRYLTRDDPEQYQGAKAFLESSCTQKNPGYINAVVLCELVWVLRRAYDATKEELVLALEQILRTRQFDVADRDAVRAAVETFKHSNADFADCLIDRLNAQGGCTETVTFDRSASALDGFRLL